MTTDSNMIFSVRNYGPIAKAEGIELRPLTVFVGPSNTGKSYLAILIYAFFRTFEDRRFEISRSFRGFRMRHDYPDMDKIVRDFLKKKPKSTQFSDLPEGLQDLITKEMTQVLVGKLGKSFHQEILRCMGVSLQEREALIKSEFDLYMKDYKKNLSLKSSEQSKETLIAGMEIEHLVFTGKQYDLLQRYLSNEGEIPDGYMTSIFLEHVLAALIYSYDPGMWSYPFRMRNRDRGTESFYLPAARTGIMQSHRAIASALVRRAAYAGIENFSIPTLSGILSDFLQGIIQLETDQILDKNIGKIADEMESKVLRGKIIADLAQETQYPQFSYEQRGIKIPLLRTSSMVSELAPIVLFLRYRVKKGDLLIIEEPESHLHPAAQRNMAGVIVGLIRAGVRVIVTTHSDYFLDQLGNHVLHSQLLDKKKKPVNGKNTFLKEEEIGAYSFQKKAKGTVVKPLPFDRETSFSPEDHSQVSSDLYNETVELLDEIESNE